MSGNLSASPSAAPAQRPERLRAKQAKQLMLEMLTKYPLVEAACAKAGISRSTHYEWLKNDSDYCADVGEATKASLDIVTDIAESNIIEGIKRGEHKASTFWLTHRHPAYKQKNQRAQEAQEPAQPASIDFAVEASKRLGKEALEKILSPQAMKKLKKYRPDLR